MNTIYSDLLKLINVLTSCVTVEQTTIAIRFYELMRKKYGKELYREINSLIDTREFLEEWAEKYNMVFHRFRFITRVEYEERCRQDLEYALRGDYHE